jgi:uncharacterized secreted protein with C-terminal beta-propeller domain
MKASKSLALWLIVSAVAVGTAIAAAPDGERTRSRRAPMRRLAPEPPTSSVALKAVDDCQALRSYVSEVVLETLIKNLYWWGPMPMGGSPWAGAEDGARGPDDYTTTNVQEQGVDELDMVKTDGRYLYVADSDLFAIVRSWPPDRSRLVSSARLEGSAIGLFLHEDLVVVFSNYYGGKDLMPQYWGGTRIQIFDVSDRREPRALRTIDFEGSLADARLIDGHLYAVISTPMQIPQGAWDLLYRDDLELPELDWDATEEERQAAMEKAREILRPLVDEIVARLGVEEMVPLVRDQSLFGPELGWRPLLACDELYRPAEVSEYSVLSVVHLPLDDSAPSAGRLQAAGVIADGWTVYASARNLYVAQSSWWWWGWGPLDMDTAIHKFELDPSQDRPVRYAASGEVEGWLHNQFSMGEHEGFLRVATTEHDWWWGTTEEGEDHGSLITVLADNGAGELEAVGRLTGIAPGERIYACRFMADRGYLVTFVQLDPLFTLDLSEPTAPRIAGELEITGYSSYLHPVGDDHLLAVGVEADEQGAILGMAVSVFDVSDFDHPELAHRYLIEDDENTWSWSEALDDHHAFTYHREVLSIPAYVSGKSRWFSGLLVLMVDPEHGIGELGWVDHADLPPGPWGQSAWMRRSVYIEDALYSLSNLGVKVNRLLSPSIELAQVPFFEPPGSPGDAGNAVQGGLRAVER